MQYAEVYVFLPAAILSTTDTQPRIIGPILLLTDNGYSPLTQRELKSELFRERSQAVAQKLLQGFLTHHSVTRATITWMNKSRLGFI